MLRAGQALRWAASLLLAVPLLGGIALGVLAWRLSAGPIEIEPLARHIERTANADGGPLRLSIGSASLAWEGFRGEGAPLDMRLSGVRLTDAQGRLVGTMPDATVTFALGPLWRGQIAPDTIELFAPRLRLRRAADGSLALDDPRPTDAATPPAPPDTDADPAPAPAALPLLLAELVAPRQEGGPHTLLRRLRVVDGAVTLHDSATGQDWTLRGARLSLWRPPGGGVQVDGEAVLEGGAGPTPLRLPVHVLAVAGGAPAEIGLRVEFPLLRPEQLAALLPELAPLSALDAALDVQARLRLDAHGRPLGLEATVAAPQGGRLRMPEGAGIPFAELEAELLATEGHLRLDTARLVLADAPGLPLHAAGDWHAGPQGWAGRLALGLAAQDVSALPALWPAAIAPEARAAAQGALRSGALEEAILLLDMAAGPGFSGLSLSQARAVLRLREAHLAPAGIGEIRLAAAEAHLRLQGERLTLEALRADLPGDGTAAGPRLLAYGAAERGEEGWTATLNLDLDHVRAADLARHWPEELAGGARRWIAQNVTEGEVTGGRWRIALTAPPDLSRPRLAALEGEARLAGATIHHLRPMPPVQGVGGLARFGRDEIVIETTGGALPAEAGEIASTGSRLHFRFSATEEHDSLAMRIGLAGAATALVDQIRHERLRLFQEGQPFPVTVAAGRFEGHLDLTLALVRDIRTEHMQFAAAARLEGVRLRDLLRGQDLEAASGELSATLEGMRVAGTGRLAATPLRYEVEVDFRSGPAGQVITRERYTARPDAAALAALDLPGQGFLDGRAALTVEGERRRGGAVSYRLGADLAQASLRLGPLAEVKPRGARGRASAVLRLQEGRLTGIEGIRIEAPDLALQGRAVLRGGEVERIELGESRLGASRFMGDIRFGPGAGRQATLRGPVLDLRPFLAREGEAPAAPAPAAPDGRPLGFDLRFDRVALGPGREVYAAQANGALDAAGGLEALSLRGRTARGGGGFTAELRALGQAGRRIEASAEDGGALLRALDITGAVAGGRLSLRAEQADRRAGTPLSGVAEIDDFALRDAPAIGRLLQAMTLFGLVDALRSGEGLVFARAVVPFSLTPDALHIQEARAFSASLGLTARGRIGRAPAILDIEGTIVPAYMLNAAMGNIPILGRLFSPEAGGGIFAATFRAQGSTSDPQVTVNPLAALTPGFLRGLFGGETAQR